MSASVEAIRQQSRRRYRAYPDYKGSGLEWLGRIPAHWEVKRLKTVASVQLSNVDKKTVEGEEAVRLCNYVDVYYNKRIDSRCEFMAATATSDQIRRFALKKGDVLITKDSESWTDIAVAAVVGEDLPGVICGYHLAQIRPSSECDGAFLSRAFGAIGPRDQFQIAANGITRFGLGGDAISTGVFAMPPLAEQRTIATFLDRETGRIDALVAKKERLIDLLQEKRSALITRAVTKGLDPSVRMKNSGIQWMGKIPTHWTTLALARVTLSRCDGPFGSGLKSAHYTDAGVRVIRLQNIGWSEFVDEDRAFVEEEYAAELGDHSVHAGDLLVAGLGDDAHPVGRTCVAPDDINPAMVKADCFRFRLDRERILPWFAAYQLSATAPVVAGLLAMGATRERINLTAMARRTIGLPPLKEQQAIVELIDHEAGHYRALIAKIESAIETLRELRNSLISAAVTGKIDVREEAA